MLWCPPVSIGSSSRRGGWEELQHFSGRPENLHGALTHDAHSGETSTMAVTRSPGSQLFPQLPENSLSFPAFSMWSLSLVVEKLFNWVTVIS